MPSDYSYITKLAVGPPHACSQKGGPIFNTGPYSEPPLEIKILKGVFLHARGDQRLRDKFS